MGIYGEKKDYEQLVKENIEKARLLYSLSEEEKKSIIELLNKKELIKEKNGLFASIRINRINKKIENIRNQKKTQNYN